MPEFSTIINQYSTGSPGITITERVSESNFVKPQRGVCYFVGALKRGPRNAIIPVISFEDYQQTFGDPNDSEWHLYPKGDHLLPDMIQGFFRNSNGAGMIWLTRIDLGGQGKKASRVFNNRHGAPMLKVVAASEGRWAGAYQEIEGKSILFNTERTFTIVAPGVEANEFESGFVVFEGSATRYPIIANTAADPETGSVIFTVSPQFNLTQLISGISTLTGTAEFVPYESKGTITYNLKKAVTGTAFSATGLSLTGTGGSFTTELSVGDILYVNGEAQTVVVQSISSDTLLTTTPAINVGTITTLQTSNLTVTGTATTFQTDFSVGGDLYVDDGNGGYERREIAAIVSDTELTLVTGFEAVQSSVVAYGKNSNITVTGGNLATELASGDYIISPFDSNVLLEVASVDGGAGTITLQTDLEQEIPAGTSLKKSGERTTITIEDPTSESGLSIIFSQGRRFPATHFGMSVYFNGRLVMTVEDASLDPADPLFVEPLVEQSGANLAYRTGVDNFYRWITVESLLNGAYTTNKESDMRPINGAGEVLVVDANRIYTNSTSFDYNQVGNSYIYPDPYKLPRSFFRIVEAVAPVSLDGSLSTTERTVNGTNTEFTTQLSVGDYIYDPGSNEARKIVAISDDGTATIDSAFDADLVTVESMRLGYIEIGQTYDLASLIEVGSQFSISYISRLQGGYDGDMANIKPSHYLKYADPDLNMLEEATFGLNMGTVRIASDIDDPYVQQQFIRYAEENAYEYRALIPLWANSAPLAESFVNNDLGRSNNLAIAFPSYGYYLNPLGAGDRLIPLSGDILGGESAKAIASDGYHRPFAGIGARLSRIRKLPHTVDIKSQEILNSAGIQPIRTISGTIVVYGARCPAVNQVFDYLHVGRTQREYIRVFLEASTLLEKLFLPKDPLIVEHLIMTFTRFFEAEYRKGALDTQVSFERAASITTGNRNSGVGVIAFERGKIQIAINYAVPEIIENIELNISPRSIALSGGGGNFNFAA